METLRERMEIERKKLRDKLAAGTSIIPPMTYTCATCQDIGLVRFDTDDLKHPMFGKLVPCPDCGQARKTPAFEDTSGLHPSERSLGWADLLKLDGRNIQDGECAVTRALHRGYGWVYLHGDYGLGKTLLLKVAVARCLQRGIHAIYTSTAEIMDELRAAYDATNPNEEALRRLNTFIHVPVLAVDEFEKVNETGFVQEKRFRLFDKRYERATRQEEGVTLFAANLAPEKVNDPALRDRLLDARFARVELTGASVRRVSDQLKKE